MFILTTPEGGAYHNTDGMPTLLISMDQIENDMSWQRAPKEWDVLELSVDEAREIHIQAFLAIYGRRAGLDV